MNSFQFLQIGTSLTEIGNEPKQHWEWTATLYLPLLPGPFLLVFHENVCVVRTLGEYLLQAAPRVFSVQHWGREGKLLFTRSTANGLMRIFHAFWMFAKLKALET